MSSFRTKTCLITSLFGLIGFQLFAATINVPADYGTIEAAVAAADAGDEVVIAAGTYYPAAQISLSKGITVRGATGNRDDVILDCGGANRRCFYVSGVTGSVISDLTIRNLRGNNNAVNFAKSGSIINCRITGCRETAGNSTCCILGDNNVAVTVKDCLIDGNEGLIGDDLAAYGSYRNGKTFICIYVQGGGSVIDGCVITNNHQYGCYVAGTMGIVSLKGATISNCEIAYNTIHSIVPYTGDTGYALQCNTSAITFSNVSVHDNHYWGTAQNPSAYHPVKLISPSAEVTDSNNGPLYTPRTGGIINVPADYTTLAEAYAAANPYDEIVLAEGTHTLAAVLDVKKPVVIRGATGNRDDVKITGNNNYCIRLWTEGAEIKHVTLTGLGAGSWRTMYAPIGLFGAGRAENCRVTATAAGGTGIRGIRNYNGTVINCKIDNCSWRDSYANNGTNGNGFYWQHGTLAFADRLVIVDNRAWDVYEGGGQYLGSAGMFIIGGTVRNSIVARNRMEYQSKITSSTALQPNRKALGVYMTDGLLENCTVVDNVSSGTAQENVGGVVQNGGTVKNCLIWGNGDENGSMYVNWTGDVESFSYCATTDIGEMAGGVALTAAPHQYVDGVPMLLTETPARNSGLVSSWMTDAVDFIGNPRLAGGRVDIGAVQFVSDMTVTWEATKYRAYEHYDEWVEAGQVTGDTTGLQYLWDLDGDGVYELTGSRQKINFNTTGEHVVTLKVTNTNGGEATCQRTFTILPRRAVPVASNDDLVAAVNAAADGDRLLVAAGTYSISESLMLTNEVLIVGATGNRDDVIIDAGNVSGRRCAWIDNENAGAENVTFTRGYTVGRAYGVYNKGTLKNCRITNCKMFSAGGDDADHNNSYPHSALYNDGGIVLDCLIDGNYLDAWYGNNRQHEGIGVYQSAGLMDRCVITNNYTGSSKGAQPWDIAGGVYQVGGTVRNCLIGWNSLSKLVIYWDDHKYASGAYVAGGTFVNNTVIGNTLTEAVTTKTCTYGSMFVEGNGVVKNALIDNDYPAIGDPASFVNCCMDSGAYQMRPDGRIRISSSSPCYNAGANENWMDEATDLYGTKRIFGTRVDIGCVECAVPRGSVFSVK